MLRGGIKESVGLLRLLPCIGSLAICVNGWKIVISRLK